MAAADPRRPLLPVRLRALVYQVLWLRLLSLIFGVTVYAASTVLAAFMAGLAFGSIAAGLLADRARRPLVWFASVEMLVGLTALASPAVLDAAERVFVGLAPSVPDSLATLTLVRFACAFAVLVVPAALMGATLPLVVKSSLVRGGALAGQVGLLYGANTAGAVAGALVAGMYLVGSFGIRTTFLVAAAVNASAAVAAFAVGRGRRAAVAIADAETGHAGEPPPDGDAPLRVRRTVLAVFALSGFTRDDDVSVDVVELSQAVINGARWFRQVNHDVLDAPNVRLRVDDGRNFLLLNKRRYDVITADLIQPGHAGAGNLYSVEYFRLARAALDEDGVMLQWIGNREVTPYKLIMRTFLEVFPHATLWANGSLMVGTRGPLRLDREAVSRRLADPALRTDLASSGLDSSEALLRLYTAGPDEMRDLAGPGNILTDDRPLVEYFRTLPQDEPMIDLDRVEGDVRRHLLTPP